ncbi:MAG: 2-dehydropantoate 2-reductase [bacterium]
MKENPSIVILGAGAIGGSVGAWIAEKYKDIYFLDQGKIADAMREKGITTYLGEKSDKKTNVRVNVISDLSEIPTPDAIAICVKNYSLDAVSKMIKEKVGDAPVIIAMQNGIENQAILPKYFSKIIYCVISYNAWIDEPGVIGYQKRGPLIIGTLINDLNDEMEKIAKVFNKGVETIITPHIQDAARSKMVINLTNSLTTLVGHRVREISDPSLFQNLLSNLTLEGARIVKNAGYKECKLGGMPSWTLLAAGAKLPQFITKGMFEKNVAKMVMSSMAQDVIMRGSSDSELESLNGYFIKLADKQGMKVPYNRAVYELCKREFAKPKFEPIDVTEVYAKVEEYINK